MDTLLKKRAIPHFGFGLPLRSSILPESPAKAKDLTRKSKLPKSDHPAFDGESDPEPNESDEEWGNKGLLQPPPRPFTIHSNRASGLPSSPARGIGLPGLPARRMPGQFTSTPRRPSQLPVSSSALGQPPIQPHLPEQEYSLPPSLPPSQPVPLQDAQSQVPPVAPVLSSQVQSPTVFVSLSRLTPSGDAPQPPLALSPITPDDLLRPSRTPSPETPTFDIIDAYDYVKRVTLDQLQREQQVVMPESIHVSPPFTYTNALREEPIAEDDEESPYLQPTQEEETSPPLSHKVELPSSMDETSLRLPPTEDLPRVEAQPTSRRLPEIVLAPSSVQSPDARSSSLYSQDNTGTSSPLAPRFNIVTPTVPPVPPPIGLTITHGENSSHRRYTPLSIPGEILSLSSGEESSPVAPVGLARTPRTANFEVVLFGMGEDKVEHLAPETNGVSNALLPPNAGVSKEARGPDTFSVSPFDSAITREATTKAKVYPPQGLVGREIDVAKVHKGRFASQGLEDFDTSAVSHNGRPKGHGEDDGGNFERIAAAEVVRSGPRGDLDSQSNGDVKSGTVRTAGEVSISSALALLPSQHSSFSSRNGREVEDDSWYPSLPTDAVVAVMPKKQGKPKPKLVSTPVPEVKRPNQSRDATLKGLARLAKNRPPPVRPPRPPSLGLDLSVPDAVPRENRRFKPLKDRRGQQERSGAPVAQYRGMDESGARPASVTEPVQVSVPMRIPKPASSFSPLTITLDTVSLSDMLGANAAPDASQPQEQVDYALFVSPKEAKRPAGSALRPASTGSDILGMGEALSWKPASSKPRVEPVTLLDAGQSEFGKRDLGRNAANVQGPNSGFSPSSSSKPYPITLPTPNKPAFGPSTPMFPDTPPYHPTQSVLPSLQMPTKSVFEPPTPMSIDTTQKRGAISPFNNSIPRPTTSMPLDMLPIFPPAPTSSPPRPKHAQLAVQIPDFVPATPVPEYRAPSLPHVTPYEDLRNGEKVPLRGPWVSSPSNLASLEPVAGGSHPTIAPPHSVPEEQVGYHPRSTSLPKNQMGPSSPPDQSGGVTASPPNGHVRPSLPNGAGMDETREGVTRSYYENLGAETSRFPSVSSKEKKKPAFAGVVGALLRTKRFNKRPKPEKHELASIEEQKPPRSTSELGDTEQENKQDAPTVARSVLSPKQPTGQAHMSPPPFPQQSPPTASSNILSQSLPVQGPTNTLHSAQQINRDGSVSREQRVQPAATGVSASDDVQVQPVAYKQDQVNEADPSLPPMRVSEDTPYLSSSRRPVVTATPPLVYFPSVPIATHVASVSIRLEAERDSAMSGGDPIPSLNTASLPQIISSLSHLNMRIGEACAILTKAIVSSRIATGESGASSGVVDTRRMSAKVEKDMRTRVCEFLTDSIFGRFSVALDGEEDQALREAHGEVFVRYPQLLSARWRVLACTSTAPSPDAAPTILDSLLRAGVGAVLGNDNPDSKLVQELSTLLRPVFRIALELSTRLHVDMIEYDYGVFSGTGLGGVADLRMEECHDPEVDTPFGSRVGGFWSLGLRRAKWEGDGDERKLVTEVLVKPRVYIQIGSKLK